MFQMFLSGMFKVGVDGEKFLSHLFLPNLALKSPVKANRQHLIQVKPRVFLFGISCWVWGMVSQCG